MFTILTATPQMLHERPDTVGMPSANVDVKALIKKVMDGLKVMNVMNGYLSNRFNGYV